MGKFFFFFLFFFYLSKKKLGCVPPSPNTPPYIQWLGDPCREVSGLNFPFSLKGRPKLEEEKKMSEVSLLPLAGAFKQYLTFSNFF